MRTIVYIGIFFAGACFGCVCLLSLLLVVSLFQQVQTAKLSPIPSKLDNISIPTETPVLVFWTATPVATVTPTFASIHTLLPTNNLPPTATDLSLPTETPTPNCDPSYPDFCLEPNLSDLNCEDEPIRNFRAFRVLPPDPHGLDGQDADGIGCENN
jgi:hypothetical protein